MKEPQRSSLHNQEFDHLKASSYAHSYPYGNEEQTSERRDDVFPLSTGRLCAGACEQIPRTFAAQGGFFYTRSIKYYFSPCVSVH